MENFRFFSAEKKIFLAFCYKKFLHPQNIFAFSQEIFTYPNIRCLEPSLAGRAIRLGRARSSPELEDWRLGEQNLAYVFGRQPLTL
jgi:hypothetical protein